MTRLLEACRSRRTILLTAHCSLLTVFILWATIRLFVYAAADIYDCIGRQKLESSLYESAESYFAKSIRLAGGNCEYQMDYGDSLYALAGLAKSSDAARAALERGKQAYLKATELNPREGNAWLGLAQTCWWLSRFNGHEGEFQNVESYFQRALATDPNNGKFLYAMVDYYLSAPRASPLAAHRWSKAGLLTALNRLAVVYPGAFYDLKKRPGWSQELQDNFIQGLKAAAVSPLTDDSALSILAGLAAESKKWDQAAAFTGQLIRQTEGRIPPSPPVYLQLGYYQLEAGRPAEAKKAFLTALRYSENRIETLDNLLWRFQKTGALDLYLDLAKETAAFDPAVFSSLQLIRGKAYFLIARDLESAETSLRQALQVRQTAAPHRWLAEIAIYRKDWDKAEMESHRASILAPKDGYLYFLLARSLQEQHRYIAALEAIGQAIQNAPRPNESYYNMQGWIYWSLNDYPAAIQAWESAGKIAPKAAWPSRQIAQAYKMLKDYAAAERFYLAALVLDPGNGDIAGELQALRAQRLGQGVTGER